MTGDHENMFFWMILLVMSFVIIKYQSQERTNK